MGRPIKRKFFGVQNVNDGLTYTAMGGESVSSITYTNRGTNYSQGLTATIAASPIGGTSAVITIAAVVGTTTQAMYYLLFKFEINSEIPHVKNTGTNIAIPKIAPFLIIPLVVFCKNAPPSYPNT